MRVAGPFAAALALYVGSRLVRRFGVAEGAVGPPVLLVASLAAVALATYGGYRIVDAALRRHTESKRHRHDARNLLRLTFGVLGLVAGFGVVTRNWVSVLFSLGIVGFAVTFALQWVLSSLVGWLYILTKRPYGVGDRIAIGDEMADNVATYRARLAETPVELDVNDRPTVNVVQRESWVELRLRYLVHPRRGTRNALYRAILDRFNDHPERVKFPVSHNR